MTPYELDILLHYHTMGDDWNGPSFGNPLWRDTIRYFIDSGLLNESGKDNPALEPTEKLHFYIECLLSIPLPEQIFRIPEKGRGKHDIIDSLSRKSVCIDPEFYTQTQTTPD